MKSSILNTAPSLVIFVFCILVLKMFSSGGSFPVSALLSTVFMAGVLLITEDRWERERLCLAAVLALCALFLAGVICLRARDPLFPKVIEGTFMVTSIRKNENSVCLVLKGPDGIAVDSYIYDMRNVREGDLLSFKGFLSAHSSDSEFSDFSPRRYWLSRNVDAHLQRIENYRYLGRSWGIHAFRDALRRRIAILPPRCGGVIAAVLLGDREFSTAEDFRRWGMNHYLAVSGWHVGLVMLLCGILLRKVKYPILCCSAVLWLYCTLTGGSASAVRAALMIQIAVIASGVYGGCDGMNTLGLAGILMLLLRPAVLYDIGWQLSVIATLLVLSFCRMKNTVIAAIAVSPAIWFCTSPLIAPLAGGISFSSIPVNLMATVFFTPLLIIVLLCALPALLMGPYMLFPAFIAEKLLDLWGKFADFQVSIFPASLTVGAFAVEFCVFTGTFIVLGACGLSRIRALLLSLIAGGITAAMI